MTAGAGTGRTLAAILAVALALSSAGCRGAPEPAAEARAPDGASEPAPEIAWRDWSPAVFTAAAREERLVLLDLGAVWCHWCHVMDEQTYRDPAVARLVSRGFIPVRVDQDARPDLAVRFEDYGWPATIIFNARGEVLRALTGYQPARRFAAVLEAVRRDPTPTRELVEAPPAEGPTAGLSRELRRAMHEVYVAARDPEQGGWGGSHKWLDWDMAEYALERARDGDEDCRRELLRVLDQQRNLIDPVWGGVYQYSDSGVWTSPHYEKLLRFQAENLRLYAQASALFGRPRDEASARAILRYMRDVLKSPEGAFYASQDADVVPGEHAGRYFALDDAGRRARGLPRVDRATYARENGHAMRALAIFGAITGDETAIAEAERVAAWLDARRRVKAGLARGLLFHGAARPSTADPAADPADSSRVGDVFLDDQIAVGRGLVALYDATGDRRRLERSRELLTLVDRHFRARPGYATSPLGAAVFAVRHCDRRENAELCRWAAELAARLDDSGALEIARHAMARLSAREVALQPRTALTLLADRALRRPGARVVVVGARRDASARALFRAVRAWPTRFKVVEWWDPAAQGASRLSPELPGEPTPAAWICGETRCSPPLTTAEQLASGAAALGVQLTLSAQRRE